jgi:hypothetical protein
MLNARVHFKCLLSFIGVMLLLTLSGSPANAQMGGGGMGRGMSGMMLISGGRPYRADGTMLQMTDAIYVAQTYMNSIHMSMSGLLLDEIEEWEFNYYVVVKEPSPSTHKAFQLVIDKWTGLVMPEPGPNMMWNTKYCKMMGGACGGFGGSTVTPSAAIIAGNNFLHQRFGRNLMVVTPPDLFYGYYTFDVKDVKTGAKYGMLSVEETSGQVWYHTWHGKFIQGREL